MNLGLLSLLLLALAIVVGFLWNGNVGLLCVGLAMVLTLFYGESISAEDVISGFNTSLFIQMVGVSYLFSIIQSNGTLELAAKKIVSLVPARAIPVVMFFIGMALSASGPGALSVSAGINPIMTSIIGDMGAMAGRMSPLTPEAAVVRTLMEAQGLDGNTIPIMICTFITAVVVSILIAVYYKGWRVDNSYAGGTKAQLPSFSWQQILSLVGLSIMAVGALFLGWNVGLTGFLIGTVLVVLGCGDEKKAVSGVPCGVILMVLGVGMLMNIVSLSGGIDLLVGALETFTDPRSAYSIMALTAGFLSFFSSGLGVVFPTLVPVCGGLAESIGVDGIQMVAMVVIGGTIAGYTPISTTGALIMAGVAQQEDSESRFPQNKQII